MSTVVDFRDVNILFGKTSARALKMLDEGRTRSEVAAETGNVLGVAGANLAVDRGEICVLMGLSGSGKSTLLRAANGLNKVARGKVLIGEAPDVVDVASCDERALRKVRLERVSMVFQQFGLLPWRTVRENVGLGLELRGGDPAARKKVVDEQLALVGLDQWADRYASELSGGMQQRVGLARALAMDPDILLMDEPFSALDPLIRTKLQDELLALQAAVKKTILFVSHDLDEALKIGNHISILEGGRIVQTGTPEDIVLRPANDYVGEFVRHMNPLTVLRGATVMRPAPSLSSDGRRMWLDDDRRYALNLDSGGQPVDAHVGGIAHSVTAFDDIAHAMSFPGGLVMVPCRTSLRHVLELRQSSGHPVLLSEDGVFRGVCGDADILKALSGVDRPRARVAEPV